MDFTDTVIDLYRAGISTELLVPSPTDDQAQVGIRLRTYGKSLPKNRMVLGVGANYTEALQDAVGKAERGRWESLVWAARPWVVANGQGESSRYGL